MAEVSTRGSGGRRAGRSADSVVLDASAILAVLYGEPGHKEIRRRIQGVDVVVCAVNLYEVSAQLAKDGFTWEEAQEAVGALSATVHPLDENLARAAGELAAATEDRSLSLGDRACLALANSLGVAAITTDSGWEGLQQAEVIRR